MGKPWYVHCPAKISHIFKAAERVQTCDELDLTISLRSHLAEDVQVWVAMLLNGELTAARATVERIINQGFNMYVTRDFEQAKTYARDRYAGQLDKRFGILASSKGKNLPIFGIHNDWSYTSRLRQGPWYNDNPDSANSCCQLTEVATEFSCQGLELDFPVVAWGSDLKWNGETWISPPQPRSGAHDPHQLRINSYRVLLSRGRDGFIIFIPNSIDMNSTYDALRISGVSQLT